MAVTDVGIGIDVGVDVGDIWDTICGLGDTFSCCDFCQKKKAREVEMASKKVSK